MTREEMLKVSKPILFNTEMVRAIRDYLKTETRRVLKPQPYEECIEGHMHEFVKDSDLGGEFTGFVCRKCGCGVCSHHDKYPVGTSWIRPKYKVGDILYVRETFFEYKGHYHYKADGKHIALDKLVGGDFFKWQPSIHMTKEAARIFLRVTGIRVERLQDITEEQAIAEGVRIGLGAMPYFSCKDAYSDLWNRTTKKSDLAKYGWATNPWVWVIKFERAEVTE